MQWGRRENTFHFGKVKSAWRVDQLLSRRVKAGMRCKSDSIIIKALFLLLLVLHHVLILILIFVLLLTDN